MNLKAEHSNESSLHRWATRLEAMRYARVGSTKMNEMMQGGRILAKKDGRKVIVDLHSIDRYYAALPDVGSSISVPQTGRRRVGEHLNGGADV